MVDKATIGDEALYRYLIDISVRANPTLQQANEISRNKIEHQMQSLPEALNLLQWLVTTINAKKILEIGTFTGISALAMAMIDPAIQITTLDKQTDYTDIAQTIWQKFSHQQQINLIIQDAKQSCEHLIQDNKVFDLVFVDANKKDYPKYYEYAYNLTKVGGVIVIDNVLLKGRVIDAEHQKQSTQGVKRVNDIVFNDPRVCVTSLPLADGMTLATKLV